jgi:uncharacterized LabA/DUF88 family protein
MSCVGFLDYGFLSAEGAKTLGLPRARVRPDAAACVHWFADLAAHLPSGSEPLLRVYWYDAAFDPRHARYPPQRRFFDALGATPGLQLRLGHLQEITPGWHHAVRQAVVAAGADLAAFERHFEFRPQLAQKGVDTLMALDLVRLAQRDVYATAIVVAGDRDLAEPVRVAQDEGRRVIVAVPRGAGFATELR